MLLKPLGHLSTSAGRETLPRRRHSVKRELDEVRGANAGAPGDVSRSVMARNLSRLAPTALVAALAFLTAAPPAAAAGKLVEETVDVPRATRVPLSLSFEKSTLFAVESQNDPKPADIEEAKAKDPKDTTWVLLRFLYRNDGWTKQKVKIRALLLDEAGGVLADAGRGATLDKQQKEDTVSFPMKVKTVDWGRATKLKLLVTFLD